MLITKLFLNDNIFKIYIMQLMFFLMFTIYPKDLTSFKIFKVITVPHRSFMKNSHVSPHHHL